MDNSSYNSLTNKLIQNGIIKDTPFDNPDKKMNASLNFFNESIKSEEKESIESENKQTPVITNPNSKKRLNRFEIEADESGTNNAKHKENVFLKMFKSSFSSNRDKSLFMCLFPKIYKAHLAKDALKELTELGIDTDELHNKTIPYGESESRYKKLIKYLKYANELQIKIKNKTN